MRANLLAIVIWCLLGEDGGTEGSIHVALVPVEEIRE